jgi:hypothetical protein
MSRFSLGKRKAENQAHGADFNSQHVTFENPTVKRLHFTTISDSGAREIEDITGRLPIYAAPPPPIPDNIQPLPTHSEKARTQVFIWFQFLE